MTGSTGFLGSHLLKALLEYEHKVYCLRRKTSKFHRVQHLISEVMWLDSETIDFNDFFSRHQIDLILHCATDYGRKYVNPIKIIDVNLILPLKILHAATQNGVSAFINTDTILDKGVSNYSLSKKQFLDWLESYSNGIITINIALGHFYGPSDDNYKFVSYIIHSFLSGVECIQLTKGHQKRDFIFIDDVISAFLLIIKNLSSFNNYMYRFEVGSNQPIEVREFVELVKRISKNNNTILDFGAIPYRANEAMSSDVNISELEKLGWKSKIPLEDGLARTINFEKNR